MGREGVQLRIQQRLERSGGHGMGVTTEDVKGRGGGSRLVSAVWFSTWGVIRSGSVRGQHGRAGGSVPFLLVHCTYRLRKLGRRC